MIISNSIASFILIISIFVVHSIKNQREKLKKEKEVLELEIEKLSNGNMTEREPINDSVKNTPRTDDMIITLLRFFDVNRVNNIFYNKKNNNIEMSLV
jgi:hypothetical protein